MEARMLTVDDYGKIRMAHRDGMPIRAIARTFGHSRRKVREILGSPQPKPYTRGKARPAPVLGLFHAVIDAVLAEDEQAPPKQRHTAMQLYRRLCDEHQYRGGYDQVRRYVGKHRRVHRETFIPLAHDPGQRLEFDFGHIYVDFPDGRRLVPVLIGVSGCVPAEPDSVSPGRGTVTRWPSRNKSRVAGWSKRAAATGEHLNPGGSLLGADVGPFYAPITTSDKREPVSSVRGEPPHCSAYPSFKHF
jgi:hypothetical protein